MTPTPARSVARRMLWHPLPWAVVCFAGAVLLFGVAQEFWGFLMSLVAGWAIAQTVLHGLALVRPRGLSVALHLALAALAGVLLFAVAQPGEWPVPPAVRSGLSFAALTFSGWIWLSLIGRVTGAVQASSDRRAAVLVEPEWERSGTEWTLRLPTVPLRRSTYLAVGAVLTAAAAGAMGTFVLVFTDLAQRLGPMAMLLVLGWTVGLPVYVLVRALARVRTVMVEVRLCPERVRVRTADGVTLMDAGTDGIRSLSVSSRNAPTRIVVRPIGGPGLVLLVGMARRPKGTAATVPELPRRLRHALEGAGLTATAGRRARAGEVTLERAAG
ncbi:MAG: putative rane protein [Microbacterium sp.]|nr:putative rane protein [Microbacterium sp.]